MYVGAGALALLAVAVILMGLFANRTGRAEGLAVLGFFGYLAYLVAATVVLYVMSRKSLHAELTPQAAPDGKPGCHGPGVAPAAPAPSSPSRAALRPLR